jgi:membrane peptidoglycan carboxypeptidase
MPWRRTSLDIVRRGMWRVVNAPEGGGRHARLDGLEIAAKTGTAEYTAPDRSRRKHTWMIAYAPYRAPKYAMAIVIEDGESGGKTAAPLVRRLFAAMYGLDPGVDEEDAPAEYHDLPPPEPEEPEEDLDGLREPSTALDGFRPTAIDGLRQPSTALDTPGAALAAPPPEGGAP